MGKIIIILIVLGLIIAGYFLFFKSSPAPQPQPQVQQEEQEQTSMPKELILTSPVFEHMGKIPGKYTCDGQKINPPLEISGVDENAKSLVLIMEDPDVPKNIRSDGMWNHWLKFNLSPSLTETKEGTDPGGASGINTSKNLNYVPPCPPDREHRYFFKLYSLDTMLDLQQGATKTEIETAMQNHILQQTTLIGLYERQ